MNCDFIEIGTSDFDTEIQNCDLTALGISIEPLKNYIDNLPDKPNVVKINCAISDQEGSMDMYYIPKEDILQHLPGHVYLTGCSSLGKPHPTLQRVAQNNNVQHLIQTLSVPVRTFKNILETHQVKSITKLKIDTEGHDCVILNNILDNLPENANNNPGNDKKP